MYDLTRNIFNTSQLAVACGGFSDVFVGDLVLPKMNDAFIAPISCKVGIKVIRAFTDSGQRDKQKAIKRLNREVCVFQRLHHANIARFLGVSYHMADHPAIIMEWYELGDAMRYLNNRPGSPLEERLKLVSGVLHGLLYLHTLDPAIVHGDLKANNVLVSSKHEAVLTDFGLSKVVEDLNTAAGSSTTTVGAGSLRWKAPELLKIPMSESVNVTLASDVWAFGCTTYQLLTVTIPYSLHKYPHVIETSILGGVLPFDEADPVAQVPSGMWDIASKCWTPKAGDRPTMDELARSLGKYFI